MALSEEPRKDGGTMSDIWAYAQAYQKLGLPIIPVCGPSCTRKHSGARCSSPGKTPLIRDWQARRAPSDLDLQRWKREFPDANIGLVLGEASGLVGIDVSGPEGEAKLQEVSGGLLPPTWSFTTGKGRRYLYRVPPGMKYSRYKFPFAGDGNELEFLGDGQQTVIPPSVHWNGRRYEWLEGLDPWTLGQPAPAPPWLLALMTEEDKRTIADTHRESIRLVSREPGWVLEALDGVPEGQRNDTAARLAGHYLAKGLPADEVFKLLQGWNLKNSPPLSTDELRRVVGSIEKSEARKRAFTAPRDGSLVFPEEAYVGIAGKFSDAYDRVTEVPREFLYMVFLAYLGAKVSPWVQCDLGVTQQPRLYVVCLAPTGQKKSTAIRLVDEFFSGTFEDWDLSMYGLGSFEAIGEELRRDPGTHAIRPKILVIDELAMFVSKARQDGSILLPALCALFEGNEFDNVTKHYKLRCRDAHVSLVAACTVETYESMWTQQFVKMGFINRLFIVAGNSDKKIAVPEPVDESVLGSLRKDLRGLVRCVQEKAKARGGKLRIAFEREAQDLWSSWYESRPDGLLAVRLDTYGFRLMTLLALSKLEFTIARQTVEEVIAILEYEYKARQLYDPVDAETLAARMEQSIFRQLQRRGPLKERDLRRFTNARGIGTWFFKRALENLIRVGDVQFDTRSKQYSLTPEAYQESL